jgi:hypothetical protein
VRSCPSTWKSSRSKDNLDLAKVREWEEGSNPRLMDERLSSPHTDHSHEEGACNDSNAV